MIVYNKDQELKHHCRSIRSLK